MTTTSDPTSRTAAFVELITPQPTGEVGTFTTKPGGGMPAGRMHGGIVMAQCLMAAGASSELNIAHSVHAQFLRPGDSTQPLKITVRALRTGKNFATSHVTACQGETVVMEAVVSFTASRDGIAHSFVAPPLTPRPEELEEQDLSWMAWHANEARAPRFPVAANGDDPTLAMWFRPIAPLPDNPMVHAAAILYQTDMPTAKYLTDYHGLAVGTQASLDHALWLHGEPRWEGWNLWSLVSPIANNSRALINGQMFASDGRLIASVAQEALYRV